MEKFELYMIDVMKDYADKIREESDKDIKWMHKCVLGELVEVFNNFQSNKGTSDV